MVPRDDDVWLILLVDIDPVPLTGMQPPCCVGKSRCVNHHDIGHLRDLIFEFEQLLHFFLFGVVDLTTSNDNGARVVEDIPEPVAEKFALGIVCPGCMV